MKRVSILLSAFLVLIFGAGQAIADTRAVYTISNIPVDKTAASTREAEAQAFASAKVQGLYRLMEKLTLPEDRARLGDSFYSYANANEMTAAVDVDDERRSTTVYRANLSVVYNPIRVRAQLEQWGVPYIDRQASVTLLAPASGGAAWADAWPEQNSGALSPYVKGRSTSSSAGWSELAGEASSVGARNAVIASLNGSEGAYSVQLTRVTSAGNTAIGTTGTVETLSDAVDAATAYMDAAWKRQSVIRGSDGQTSANATVRYSSLRSWNGVRSALSNSPLVSGLQVNAVARNGALVSFVFAGSQDRLETDLGQSGVVLSQSASGWVLQLAGDRSF
ncbi:MAG: hypothetical protein CMK07_03385 [Ponticaulis sp.]|nr:hypothetical protein [Ponticaulis sp.]